MLAFLTALLVQAGTGLFANDEIANAGPFYGWVSPETSARLGAIHATNSQVILALVALHLLAVAWHESRGRRRVRAMLTGRAPGATDGIASSRGALALLIVALLSAALYVAVRLAPEAVVGMY